MKKVTEKKGSSSYYRVSTQVAGEIVEEYEVNIKLATVNIDNDTFYILYWTDGSIIDDAYEYLNNREVIVAKNTREADAYSLRDFFSFCEIFNVDYRNMKRNDVIRLAYFLLGVNSNDKSMEIERINYRSAQTVNEFFGKFRNFLIQRDYSASAFEEYVPGRIRGKKLFTPFHVPKNDEQPKSLSEEQFVQIILWIRDNIPGKERKLRDECIVRIMYETGARIGETLGVTLEDMTRNEKYGTLKIRNRTSDKQWQCAKKAMKVTSQSDYRTKEYIKSGFEEVYISLDLFNLICEYYDSAHENARKKYKKRYLSHRADTVDIYGPKDNFYVFLNSYGSPISQRSWDEEMRKIFISNGIDVDYIIKQDGLNHRWRHGFSNYQLYVLGHEPSYVIKLTRHSSVTGLAPYNNPSASQIVEMKMEIEREILSENKEKDRDVYR